MSESSKAVSPTRLPMLEPKSSVPGTSVSRIDYSQCLEPVPFQGSRFLVEPGARSRVDSHDVAETWLIASGSGRLFHDGVEHRVEEGAAFYFRPNTEHFVENDGAVPLEIFSLWWLPKA